MICWRRDIGYGGVIIFMTAVITGEWVREGGGVFVGRVLVRLYVVGDVSCGAVHVDNEDRLSPSNEKPERAAPENHTNGIPLWFHHTVKRCTPWKLHIHTKSGWILGGVADAGPILNKHSVDATWFLEAFSHQNVACQILSMLFDYRAAGPILYHHWANASCSQSGSADQNVACLAVAGVFFLASGTGSAGCGSWRDSDCPHISRLPPLHTVEFNLNQER